MHIPLTFNTPPLAVAGVGLSAVAIALAIVRRLPFRWPTIIAGAAGLLCLAIAAGDPVWRRVADADVVVMVDLSPSTRGATYRDRAVLESRVAELLGDTPHRTLAFADGRQELPGDAVLPDLPAEKTVFSPPPATAVLLFSDGRFAPPAESPPTFAVVDPGLDNAGDAAVERLAVNSNAVTVTARGGGAAARSLTITVVSGGAQHHGFATSTTQPIKGTGEQVFSAPLPPGAQEITARIIPASDRWPENDQLTTIAAPPVATQNWWIGDASRAPAGWLAFEPNELSTDSDDYLNAAAIVLDDVPATSLSSARQARLAQFVRDLGGGVVIVGGAHAFAAGGSVGTPIEALSPLASTPPQPATHWLLLLDASGSMAQPTDGPSDRWDAAVSAVAGVLRQIPPADLVNLGSFSRDVTWHVSDRPARDVSADALRAVVPGGPTNLGPALASLAAGPDDGLPKQLLLVSDCEADLPDAAALARRLSDKQVHVNVLAIGGGGGGAAAAVRELTSATGGRVVERADARQWPAGLSQLLRAAAPGYVVQMPLPLRFVGGMASLGTRTASPWNRTWPRPGVEALAVGDGDRPVAATWQVGAGRAAAVAWGADPRDVEAVAAVVASPAKDPRLAVTWDAGARLRVAIDARETAGNFLNGLDLRLVLNDGDRTVIPIPQTGPGGYEADAPAPRRPVLATVEINGRVVARTAVAGRYSPEFDEIGNDRQALRELAERSGGAVVLPDDHGRISLPRSTRDVGMASAFCAGGAVWLLVACLVYRAGWMSSKAHRH